MIKCIAIDDEPIALTILEEYCKRYGNIDLETFSNPVEGMKRIEETTPDIAFLDVEMNSCNGIDLARLLPPQTLCIFCTAFSEYALEGFNVNAIDFLHKPFFYDRFEQAMKKAEGWLGRSVADKAAEIPTLTLKSDHKNVVIDLSTVSHIEAMDNYVKVFREGLPTVVSQITMKEMENLLPSDTFVRIHRSYIVSLRYVEAFSNRKLKVRGIGRELPVGRTYNELFTSRYRD